MREARNRNLAVKIGDGHLPAMDSFRGVAEKSFFPHPLFKNPHLATLLPCYWPRGGLLNNMPSESRLFAVTADSRILGCCHWQPKARQSPVLVLVHGLEGSSESHYMLGVAHKAWAAGFSVIRLNQRNCGRTDHLTPTLYNSGLSGDLAAVIRELALHDGISSVWLGGFSMGGNLVLRLAGEAGSDLPSLKGVAAISPTVDPESCVESLEQSRGWIYQRYFVMKLRARLRRKANLFPGRFDLSRLRRIRTLRQFDDAYTAPDGGYESAEDYYCRTGARRVIGSIEVPTLIITAQDDPIVPYHSFENPALRDNPSIRLLAPKHGGHCGFIQRSQPFEDNYWAENRLVEFAAARSGNRPARAFNGVLDGSHHRRRHLHDATEL